MSVRPSQGLFSALIQNEIGFFCQGNQVDGNFWAKLPKSYQHSIVLMKDNEIAFFLTTRTKR